jgi:hypothetical protein
MSTLSDSNIAQAIYESHTEGAAPREIVEFLARRNLLFPFHLEFWTSWKKLLILKLA